MFREFFFEITSKILKEDKVEEFHIEVEYSKKQNSVAVKLFVNEYQLTKLNETGNFMNIDFLLDELSFMIPDRLHECAFYGFRVTNATTPHVKPYPGSIMHLQLLEVRI